MNVAIIPARGGSKRIPRKNLRDFCGMPMLHWPIKVAQEAKLFDRIIVSTDDAEIARRATETGAEVPFIRPTELSGDQTPTLPVISHAVQTLIEAGCPVENACCIYATAPFLQASALREGLTQLQKEPETSFVFSATAFDFPIFRAIQLGPENQVSMFWPENEMTRSQDLPKAYHDAGQFYWGTRKAWLNEKSIFSSGSTAVILPGHLVQDIDTEEDWQRAELMHKAIARSHA